MLILASILNLISSYFIASIAKSFLVVFVSLFGFIVADIQILSLFNGIYPKNILILTFLNLIFSFILFKILKAKPLKPKLDFYKLKNAFLLDKSLIIIGFCFLNLICVSFFLAKYSIPNEPDSQTYHFYRAWQFFQNHNLSHFDTNDARALVMPINSEIIYCWMLNLKQKITGCGFLAYFSYFAIIFSIWSILKGFSIRKKLFAIFAFSSLASIVVEMSSMQTDILVGAFLISSFALYIKKNIYFSSLAYALALGTKTTSIMALIAFFIMLFLFEKKYKNILKFIIFLAINFLIFSGYNYILNFLQFQNPITTDALYKGHCFWGGIKGYINNLSNFIIQFFDTTGFTLGFYLSGLIFVLKDYIFNFFGITPDIGNNVPIKFINIMSDEQTAGFGFLGIFLICPLLIYGFKNFKKFKKNKNLKKLLFFL